jgi:hypothetical protein
MLLVSEWILVGLETASSGQQLIHTTSFQCHRVAANAGSSDWVLVTLARLNRRTLCVQGRWTAAYNAIAFDSLGLTAWPQRQ